MDTRYFGSNLPVLDKIEAGRRRLWTNAEEDAYYREHTPVERRIPRNGALVASIAIGFASIGLWQFSPA